MSDLPTELGPLRTHRITIRDIDGETSLVGISAGRAVWDKSIYHQGDPAADPERSNR